VKGKYRLLANADDFGRHELINAAVARAVAKGCLRSATLMPGGAAFADAVRIAKEQPQLGVGVHFTLVDGHPILPPTEIPTLVPDGEALAGDYTIFVKRFLSGRISLEDVRHELAAQLRKMEQTGLELTHVDSHQHMHVLPGIIDIVLDLAASAGIHKVRLPKTPLLLGFSGSPVQLVGRMGLSCLAGWAGHKAKKRGFCVPDHFAGIVAGEAVSPAIFRDIAARLRPGTTEVMMHPGTDNAVLQKACDWQHDFEAELVALTDKEILAYLENNHIQAIGFNDLT
jgi:hopanoid biosynthesis associated protein HpnK